jgi:flagellar operon protein (TIGR03826 family)
MDLKNCKKCGRMFSDTNGHEFCSKCRLEVEDHFKIAREYVYDHPGTTVNEVSEETGVPKEEILKYLREERLELVNDKDDLKCQKCGKPIKSGRYCMNCAAELKKGFDKVIKNDETKESSNDRTWHSSKK